MLFFISLVILAVALTTLADRKCWYALFALLALGLFGLVVGEIAETLSMATVLGTINHLDNTSIDHYLVLPSITALSGEVSPEDGDRSSIENITDETADTAEEVGPIHYHVVELSTGKLVKSFSSQRRLLQASHSLFGEMLGNTKLADIIRSNGLLHANTGSFLISVTGVQIKHSYLYHYHPQH